MTTVKDRFETNDERVRVSNGETLAFRTDYVKRYTVHTKDRYGMPSEEITLDVKRYTPMTVVKGAALFLIERDYDARAGLVITNIEERFGW